jgi:hypothetical protein
LSCSLVTLALGMSVAWTTAAQAGQRGETISGLPWPRTAGEAGFLIAAVAFAVWAAVSIVKAFLGIRRAVTPTNDSPPVNGTRTQERTLALIEAQQETIRDLAEGFHALHQGQMDMTRAVERVAKAIENRDAA